MCTRGLIAFALALCISLVDIGSTTARAPVSFQPANTAALQAQDNNVEYFGLGHNSQDSLYRVPFGAITPGTQITLRFRTYHDDVSSVRVRFWDTKANGQFFQEMERVAADLSCYDPAQPDASCDFWQTTYTPDQPTTLYYRFIISDGGVTAYYDDDFFRDGEWGEAAPDQQDDGFVVTVYDADFEPVEWLQNAVVYQIFPDRFRNGRSSNDPQSGEARYSYPPNNGEQIITSGWNDLPEGHCRAYANSAVACASQPGGRDYFGGDLRGVQQRLGYLKYLGVTAIYFNPIFEAASNHLYDTQDYFHIDHFFGSDAEFAGFLQEAHALGIRVILDGVFNHVSADSQYFDRYGHFQTVGACESVDSPYRSWFFYHPESGGPCAGPDGPKTMTYDSWAGFDSLPVLDKSNPAVRALINGDAGVARTWLESGVDAWRLDVMGDLSFPADFWPEFRAAVKAADPDSPIIGELWKKFEVLPKIHGDEADSAMNYRFRNAILGFFGTVDHKGFYDDGQSDQPPSLFVRKLMSIREDYPDAVYYTLLNIFDSHDTARILWSLTPGENNREAKEFNAANLARGKQLLRLSVVAQMTMPGAPTIYYGDEVGMTGDDDPDDRRTFAWEGSGPFGVGGDASLLAFYRRLTRLRHAQPVFRSGELTFLLADDKQRTLAYLLRTEDAAALVAFNRSDAAQTLTIDLRRLLPQSVQLYAALGAPANLSIVDGSLSFTLPPLSAAILLPKPGQDLTAPAAPTGLTVEEDDSQIILTWNGVSNAASYVVYRSPLSGGGYEAIAEVTEPTFTDPEATNGRRYYYIVRQVDSAGNEGPPSEEVEAGRPLVQVTWTVSAPENTPDGASLYIAGTLDRLDASLPQWNPGATVLTPTNDLEWTITLTGTPGTQIEYKYTLGSWDNVEKGAACEELANRILTLDTAATGEQIVHDTVLTWNNVAPCPE